MSKNNESPGQEGFGGAFGSLSNPEALESNVRELDNYEDIPDHILNRLDTPGNDDLPATKIDDSDLPIVDPPIDEEETEVATEETNTPADDTTTADLSEYEPEVVDYFIEQFQKEVGWEFDADEKPESVKDLVAYMQRMVDDNSTKAFANEEIAAINDFVKNGGKIEDYVNKVFAAELDLDSLDLEKTSTQRMLVSEDLRNRGFSESKINKMLSRFEETDSLEEEATDALESLKTVRTESKKKLLEQQAYSAKQAREAEQSFVRSVEETIRNTKEVLGVAITPKEQKETLEYIFKKDSSGMTQFQKEYTNNVKNLIDTAFMLKNKDKFVSKVKTQAATQATKSLRETLASRNKVSKNEPTTSPSLFSLMGAQLSKPRI